MIGYFIGWFSFFPFFEIDIRNRKKDPYSVSPERRLYWLLWTVPLECLGLFGFAWTSLGPERNVHWIAPMIFSCLIGIANYNIYMATIDYMTAAYGPYASSATGGNGLARDFLAGISAMFATPCKFYILKISLFLFNHILQFMNISLSIHSNTHLQYWHVLHS